MRGSQARSLQLKKTNKKPVNNRLRDLGKRGCGGEERSVTASLGVFRIRTFETM